MAANGFGGIRFAYVYFLRDMVALSLFEGRAADARAYYGKLADFFAGFGLAAELPPMEKLPETDPERFSDLLAEAGFR